MLNYRSVTNSEPQVRSNPALRNANSAFQKKIETLLEDIKPTFPTYARIVPKHEPILSKHPFHVWQRPAHLRSSWIIIHDSLPVLIADSKNPRQANTVRIPYKKQRVEELGTILCEGAWDAQDHKLWIWDVIYWNRTNVWNSEPYSKRWELVKDLIENILDVGNPMSDAEIATPCFESLVEVRKRKEVDSAIAIEFQPERQGQRRFLFQTYRQKQVKQSVPLKQLKQSKQDFAFAFVDDPENPEDAKAISATKEQVPIITLPKKKQPIEAKETKEAKETQETKEAKEAVSEVKVKFQKKLQYATIIKDMNSKVPDAYRVMYKDNDKGLLAVRSMDMSKKLRTLFQTHDQCVADVEWFDSFQKYELTQLYVAA